MNTGLTDENYEALSRYRQERAHETLAEIPYLSQQGYIIQRQIACIMLVIMLPLLF